MSRFSELLGQVRTVTAAVFFLLVFITVVELFFSPAPIRLRDVLLPTAVITISCSFFCSLLLFAAFNRIMTLPRPVFFAAFSLLVAAGIAVGVSTGNFILTGHPRLQPRVFLFSLVTGLVFSGAISAYFVFRFRLEQKISRLKEIELENEKLRRIEFETRLRELQAKLNPHFLFNALNSTAALIYDDPRRAEQSVERLSGLYRRVLDLSSRRLVSVGEELRLVQDFLELEKLRFDEKLVYEIACPDGLLGALIPGFLIEPLIENSVKHGSGGGVLRLRVAVESEGDGRIRLTVEDDGPGFEVEKTDAGFGLYSIQERLRLLYGGRASVEVESARGRGTTVVMRLPGATA